MGSALKPGRQKRVKGQCPLRGQGAELPCGVWGNAPTVFRALNSKKVANKGAGSEASLPVTLRVRRCAPKLLFPTSVLCRAKWARPSSCSFLIINGFSRNAGISPLRRRPKGNENRRSLRSPFGNLRRRNFWGCLRLDFYRCRKNRACGRESCHHCLAMGRKPAPLDAKITRIVTKR